MADDAPSHPFTPPYRLPIRVLSYDGVQGFSGKKKEILEFIMHLAHYFLFSPIFIFNTLSGLVAHGR